MSAPPHRSLHDILGRIHRLPVLFAVVLAAVSFTLSGALVIRSYGERNLDLVARSLADRIEPAVHLGNLQGIADGIAAVAARQSVDQVEVFDHAGHLLAHWRNPRASLPDWLLRAGNQVFRDRAIVAPLTRHGNRIGAVRVTGNPEGLLRFALAGTLIALSTLVLTGIATRILSGTLQSAVLDPLAHLSEVARAARSERTVGHRVARSGIQEFDSFADNFNALLGELQARPEPDVGPDQDRG